MFPFQRVVLKSQLEITLAELEREGARDLTCSAAADGTVEVTGFLPTAPLRKPGALRFGGGSRG